MIKLFSIVICFLVFTTTILSQNVGTMDGDTLINYIDINNKKQGKWVKNYDNGKIRYKGFFINDQPTGTFTYYHPNGNIKSLLNYDDKGCATVEQYWDNGNRATKGFYDENRERHKTWYFYFEDGVLSAVINYEHGKAEGDVRMYYPGTGTKVLECSYKDGKLNGYYKKYFQNGLVIEEGPYLNGTRHGYWKFYATTGLVDEEGPFVEGKRHGDWIIYTKIPKGDTINYYMDRPDNYEEIMKEWQDKLDWAKENQDQFKQPEDFLDNPFEFFKPSPNPKTQFE